MSFLGETFKTKLILQWNITAITLQSDSHPGSWRNTNSKHFGGLSYLTHPFQVLKSLLMSRFKCVRKCLKSLLLMCFQEQGWEMLSWTMKEQRLSLKWSSGALPVLTILLSSFSLWLFFCSLQTHLPARWQPSRTNTPMHPLEMWRVVMQLTSSWVSEWRGPSLPCTGTVRAKNLWSRPGRWRSPSPSSPSWHCCVLWLYCTAAGPLYLGASWGAREPPSCSPCSFSSWCGSSTSCCPRWKLTAMCLASEKDHKKDVLHCTTPIILPLCFCVYEKSKISVYICSYW